MMQGANTLARRRVSHSSPFMLLLAKILPKDRRETFFTWYAYLRWVDDHVDNHRPEPAFMQRQFDLVDAKPLDPPMAAEEELLRGLLASLEQEAGKELAELVRAMLECIAFDGERLGAPVTYECLRTYWRQEVAAYLGTIAYCCGVATADGEPPGLTAAVGGKIAHVLRDLHADIEVGQINISDEELRALGLTPATLLSAVRQGGAGRWIAGNARLALAAMGAGLAEVRPCRSARYKLVFALLVTKYQRIALSILRDGAPKDGQVASCAFIPLFVANVARAFLGSNPPRASETFRPAVPTSLVGAARLLFGVLPGLSRREEALLRAALSQSSERPVELGRMFRRYRVACLIGRKSLAAIAPPGIHRDVSRAAGALYGLWSVCAIEMDRLIDEGQMTPEAASAAGERWLNLLNDVLKDGRTDDPPGSFGEHCTFAALTSAFMCALEDYLTLCRKFNCDAWLEAAKADFHQATTSLMAGQLRSLLQMEISVSRDWMWYRKNILNAKNVEFLLAPFNLWRIGQGSDARFRNFVAQFHDLNRFYLHYQLIDDVADLAEDTAEGIIGAAGAILLTQGSLADWADRAISPGETDGAADEPLKFATQISSSGLLDEALIAAPMFDSVWHRISVGATTPNLAEQLSCALANKASDFSLVLPELAALRRNQARSYLEALEQGHSRGAIDIVLRSGAAHRLLNAVGDPAMRWRLADSLDRKPGSSATALLSVLERMMRHTHRAALAVAHV
jgi:phytoene/squalene synthetase